MHQILRISEVLSYIFDYALLTPEDGRLSALRSLALTCRAFSGPALAILWRSARSLVPLVKCLPAEFWEIRETDDGENTLYIKRSPDASDIRRFQKYARLIRHLNLGSGANGFGQLHSGVLNALASVLQTQQIFSNLLTLTVAENEHQELENIHLLIGENLTAFVLHFSAIDCDEEAGAKLLEALQKKSPLIENLEIGAGPQTSLSLSNALSNLVCASSHIRRFSSPCIPLSSDAFAHLSSRPDLHVLEVSPGTEGFQSLASPDPFPALHEMTIWTKLLSKASRMIRHLHPTLLETLIIHTEDTPRVLDVDEFFMNLSGHCSQASLKRIYGFQDEFQDDAIDDNVQVLENLRPLLSFHNLEYVWLNACMSFEDVNDAFIRDLASSWPRLQELDFGCTSCWGLPSRVTLDGLLAFCEFCPDLRVLGITFDATNDESPLSSHNGWTKPLQNLRMDSLQIGHSRIGFDQADAVAAFLQQIYPNLTELACWDEHDGPGWTATRSVWLRVQRLVVASTGSKGLAV